MPARSPLARHSEDLVYGATAALLLFTYATVEAFITNVLVDKIGVSNSFASALLETSLALAFHPIKKRMKQGLKRCGWRASTAS